MEVSARKVAGGKAVGDRDARAYWTAMPDKERGKDKDDLESLLKKLMDRLANNNGSSFKLGGELLFEFTPKTTFHSDRLISPETSFHFHRMEEGVVYLENGEARESGVASYNYQKRVPPLDYSMMEFMPVI